MPDELVRRRVRTYDRIVRLSANRFGGQGIPALTTLFDSVDQRVRDGASDADATLVVVENFERAGAAVNERTAPLVPASGLVVTASGLLAPLSDAASTLVFTAMLFSILGLTFLTAALFTNAGRREVGLPPTRDDVAFAHRRLLYKEGNARIGSVCFGLGLLLLIAAILSI